MTTCDDLTELDRAALQLALDLVLANDPPDDRCVEQVQSMLEDCDWLEVASFCSDVQQCNRLAFPYPGHRHRATSTPRISMRS